MGYHHCPIEPSDWSDGPDYPEQVECPDCGGDGKETCDNPDHGFIVATGHEIGRLGCPVCGHDPNHKVPNGGDCERCEGTGMVDPPEYEPFEDDVI